jgi:hypothetical protein
MPGALSRRPAGGSGHASTGLRPLQSFVDGARSTGDLDRHAARNGGTSYGPGVSPDHPHRLLWASGATAASRSPYSALLSLSLMKRFSTSGLRAPPRMCGRVGVGGAIALGRPIHRSHHLQFLGRRCRLHTAKDVHGYHADSATATSLLSSFLRLHPRPYRLIVRNKLRLCSGGCAIFRPLGRQRFRTMRGAQQPPSVCFGPMLSGVSEGMTALACVDFCRCPGWV